MKKVFALLLTVAVIVTSLAIPAAAATEKVAGGLDFYSVTVHYSAPVVVSYESVKKSDKVEMVDVYGNKVLDEDGDPVIVTGYVFSEAVDKYTISAAEFAMRNSDGDEITNQVLDYNETALKTTKKAPVQWERRFNAINVSELDINSNNLVYNNNFGISNITDNTVIGINDAASMYGVQELYDDAGNRNPNFAFDGTYFTDVTGAKIDDNGYIIDDNNIWHNYEDKRVELFVKADDGSYVWVSPANRTDENGRVVNYSKMTNADLVDKGVLSVPASLTSEKEIKDWKEELCRFETFVIAYPDDKTSLTEAERADYDSASRVITEADIETMMVMGEEMYVNGTPELGTPKTSYTISKITIELDAMGESMAADVASDPQQANEIYLTTGDIYANVKSALDYIAENPNKTYTDGIFIGVAKSVTTKTEMKDEEGIPSTVKSVDVALEEEVAIPANGAIYLTFKIGQLQPDAAAEFEFNSTAPEGAKSSTGAISESETYKLTSVTKVVLNTEKLPDAPVVNSQKSGCGSTIAGSFAILCTMAAAAFVLRKKED